MSNTRDLMQFGYRELKMAADLLTAFKDREKDLTERLGSNVAIEFNPMSGNVFLIDEDFNVAMMNGDYLEDFYSCPECGNEGFKDELKEHGMRCCLEYVGEDSENE
jgi:hypothetical protein